MTTEAAPAKRPEAAAFPFTIQLKEKSTYFPALLNGDGENFFGPLISTGLVDADDARCTTWTPAPGRPSCSLSLQGVTEVPHRVQVQLNGRPLGTVEWPSRDLRQAMLTVPIGPEGLVEGDNLISLATDAGHRRGLAGPPPPDLSAPPGGRRRRPAGDAWPRARR